MTNTQLLSDPAKAEPTARALAGMGHPVRLVILIRLGEAENSPTALAEQLRQPLGSVSYHVRTLREAGLIRETRTEPRRGALQHYYVTTAWANELIELLTPVLV